MHLTGEMLQSTILVIVLLVNGVLTQLFTEAQPHSLSLAIQPPPLQQEHLNSAQVFSADGPKRNYAHRAVIINAEHEALLPAQLLNPFYKNPRISEALAKESWLTNEETVVQDREAEKISRQKIYSVLKHAGFVNRRRR